MTKDFSVLISIYQKENPLWFREALCSIFSQTVQPSEIVLVEDGPLTPALYAIIDEYSTKYPIFNIVKNETNQGLGVALSKGIIAAKNEIIARMDTDDIIPSHRFEVQLSKINEGYDVVSCWSLTFEGTIDNVFAIKKRPENHADIVKLAHKRSPICHAGAFIRKSAVIESGNYIHKQYYEDYNLWVRMILNGCKFYNVQEILYYVRTTKEQLRRRGGFRYLKNELYYLHEFKEMGFFSNLDLFKASFIRVLARLTPEALRAYIFKMIWNHKQQK